MRNVKAGKYALNHQLQGVGLDSKKTEKYQGMSHAREELSPDIRLTDHIREKCFDPLGKTVDFQGRLAFYGHHNSDKMPDLDKKKTECGCKEDHHYERFDYRVGTH